MATTAELMAATGISSLRQLRGATAELERHGLIKVNRTKAGDIITLLDPSTGLPLCFAEGGRDK
jgi:hypothetical protein